MVLTLLLELSAFQKSFGYISYHDLTTRTTWYTFAASLETTVSGELLLRTFLGCYCIYPLSTSSSDLKSAIEGASSRLHCPDDLRASYSSLHLHFEAPCFAFGDLATIAVMLPSLATFSLHHPFRSGRRVCGGKACRAA